MILPIKNKTLEKVYGLEPYTKDCIISLCETYAELFKPYVCFEWQDLLRENKENAGFPKGCNQGIEIAKKELTDFETQVFELRISNCLFFAFSEFEIGE